MKPCRLTRRQALVGGLAAAVSLAAPALARAPAATISIGGPAYGTWWAATLPGDSGADALRGQLERTLERIDRLMSPWRADSVVAGFNGYQSTGWYEVDDETATVARAALSLRSASAGAFDPAVGPLVARWGFGPIEGEEPDGSAGFAVADGVLRKERPGLTLDFCGIAKGYALDRMVDVLREHGQENFVIDLGGEIAARGLHPEGRPWQVAVEDPRLGAEAGAAEVVALRGAAIATSGDGANGFTLGTRRYSHVIDPVTAEPVRGTTASVSVLAADAMTADGWATALMAAGANGPALARRAGLDALFLVRDDTDLRRIAVGSFNDNLA